jgi:hypothetical protein
MKSQSGAEPDPLELIRRFNKKGIRYLLIGSMALSMHDAPLGSADWDFWVASEDRAKAYDVLKGLGLQGVHGPETKRPLDIFFVKSFSNTKKKITVAFEDVYERSIIRSDPAGDFFVRVPILKDLISMLKVVDTPRPQHAKHIEYLEALERRRKKSS